jgi:excisionase family DNA binding protein
MGKSSRRVDVQLFTIAEASAQLGLSEKAIRRRIEQGSLASIRRGNRRMIPATEVDRLRDEVDFPDGEQVKGNGEYQRGGEGNPTTALIAQLGKAVETVRDETERRVNAERDRDAAIERERSEREAREAAEAEVVELRAHVMQLQATAEGGGDEVVDDAAGLDPDVVEPERRVWWQRMLGGNAGEAA